MSKRTLVALGLIGILMFVLVACQPETVEVTRVVTEVEQVQVEVTRIVEGESVVETVIEEVEVTRIVEAPEAEAEAGGPALITWWSHWANEPAKRLVIEKIVADYEAEHPDVDIVLQWWDKNPLRDAIRSTMTAGQGAPDITTFDSEVVEWVEAGWLLPLDDVLPWDNFVTGVELDGAYPSAGFPEHYKVNLSAIVHMILYNPDIFAELGIEVPENYQFTMEEFIDVVQTCSDAGYAGVANAIGNRTNPARYPVEDALLNLTGAEQMHAYINGLQSWDTEEARTVLDYFVRLRDAGMWPASFSTMTIDEFHVYFHTQRESCMLMIPTWYTGRSFKAQAEGGQDPNWHFGMLRYPLFEGAQAPEAVWSGFESGYAVLSTTRHPDVAKDILAFMSQPKYGALWTAVTNSPSAVKYDTATDWPSNELLAEMGLTPGQWDWYWEEFDKVYGPMELAVVPEQRCAEFNDAYETYINAGLPQGLVTIDEAIEALDASLCR